MGLFSKIKNILFVDDEEDEMPVYESDHKEEKQVEEVSVKPVNVHLESRFRNNDSDVSFEESDVLDEVPKSENYNSKSDDSLKVKEENRSPFVSFDADEFERLNAHITNNENRSKSENQNNYERRNNFSKPSISRENRKDEERYKIIDDLNKPRKFTPSPVISPVYGVLNKNYTKEDIVDKKDGMKRERVKPIRKEIVKEEIVEEPKVDVDSVREKAYGLESNKELTYDVNDTIGNVEDLIEKDLITEEDMPTVKSDVIEFNDDIDELDQVVESHFDNVMNKNEDNLLDDEETEDEPQLLDELEKTSTLKILDDIEKELNAVKPITEKYSSEEKDEKEEKDDKKLEDTLENDLFNLIDSMYDEGEEEENG